MVEAGSQVESSVILPEVRVEPGCRIRNAVIEKHCRIPAGTVIGEDATADAERFHVSPGGVVLVTPEMLGQGVHHVR